MSLRSAIVKWIFAFCLIGNAAFAEDEIRVALTTRTQLAPVYISRVQDNESGFPLTYLKQLKNVLAFDVRHSGYAKIAPMDDILEKALCHSDLSVALNAQRWGKVGVSYVLKGTVKNKKLHLFVLTVKGGRIQEFPDIPLTGKLHEDRRQIHRLADGLTKSLFGVDGVASSRILYSMQTRERIPGTKQWKAEIWECDWDGANAHQVSFENDYSITPVLIPAHPRHGNDRYLYVTYKNGQPKIYFSSLKSRTGKELIHLRGNQLLPAISRQRDQLAFISDATGRADLFLQTVDEGGHLIGKPKQLFSYPRSTQGSPTFSPDGAQIAFVSDKDGCPRIYTISTKVQNNKRPRPHLITRLSRENTCPTWSPDGTKLAYSAKTNGVRQIWIYDFEAEEEQQLTMGPGNKENPVWAPDSLHLVFNSTDPGISELYIVNLHQPDAVKVTQGPGKKHYPTWGTR